MQELGLGSLFKEKLNNIGVTYQCPKCKGMMGQLDSRGIEWAEDNFNFIVNTILNNAQSKEMAANDKSLAGSAMRSAFIPNTLKKASVAGLLRSCIDEIRQKKAGETP